MRGHGPERLARRGGKHEVVPRCERFDAAGEAVELGAGLRAAGIPEGSSKFRRICGAVAAGDVCAGDANGGGAELKLRGDEIDLAIERGGSSGAEGLAPKLALLSGRGNRHIDAGEQARAKLERFRAADEHGALREIGERSSSVDRLRRCAGLEFDEQSEPAEHNLAFDETGEIFAGSVAAVAYPRRGGFAAEI